MTNTIAGLPREPAPDEMVVFKVEANSVRKQIVKRDDDILSPQQVKDHWPEVSAAMLKELQTWAKLKCFSRKSRRLAHNIIDTKWVNKFKWEIPTTSAEDSGGGHKATTEPVKTIRARLTLRGFIDASKADIDRYAGTST